MHPSEAARFEREGLTDPERRTMIVSPGSTAEAQALEAIDIARSEERAALGDTFEQRRRRQARYWGKRRAY